MKEKRIADLLEKNGWSPEDEHPDYPRSAWNADIKEGTTTKDYWDWVDDWIAYDTFYDDIPM